MDHPSLFLPSTPQFMPQGHARTPSRSPTRPRLMDDMLSDLSPSTTLEAFTSASGTLSASIEAASPAQREFGIRAAIASKKIQEWQIELSSWPWPTITSEGFDIPASKRKRVSYDKHDKNRVEEGQHVHQNDMLEEYWGCLPAHDVLRYDTRIEEISEDMEELNVEEIKSQVLSTHIGQRSPTPSLPGPYAEVSTSQAYTEIDDFTAVVTATVLQALPSLSRLMALMDVWSVRLTVLRQVPSLIRLMEDAEVALESGWNTIQIQEYKSLSKSSPSTTSVLSRQDYEIMRDILQAKISKLGQKLDYMLDTLEGRADTLPESWLDRMETIEQDYGEWVVQGERKVRDGEWQNEVFKRREEQLQSSQSPAVEIPPASAEGNPVHEEQSSTGKNGPPLQKPEIAEGLPTEATGPQLDTLQDSPRLDNPVPEPHENRPALSLFDGPGDDHPAELNTGDVSMVKKEVLQPKEAAESTNHIPLPGSVEIPSSEANFSPPASHGEMDEMLREGRGHSELSPSSDFTSDKLESHVEDERSVNPTYPVTVTLPYSPTVREAQTPANHTESLKPMTPEEARRILTSDQPLLSEEIPVTPVRTPLSGEKSSTAIANLNEPSNEEQHSDASSTSQNPKIPRFGHPLANSLRRELHPEVVGLNYSFPYHSPQESSATVTTGTPESNQLVLPQNPQIQHVVESEAKEQAFVPAKPVPVEDAPESDHSKSIPAQFSDSKPMHIDLPPNSLDANSDIKSIKHLSPGTNQSTSAKGHARGPSSVSMISGYATSEPSPILYEAEPTEYFRPVSPPIIAKLPELSTVMTPVRTSYDNTPVSPKVPESGISSDSKAINLQRYSPSERKSIDFVGKKDRDDSHIHLSRRRPVSDPAVSVTRTSLPQGRISQDGSTTSEVSTINERLASNTSTPTRIESLEVETIPRSWHSQFVSDYDGDSPSLGRVRLYNDAGNYSPGDSPLLASPSERHPLQLHRTPSFDTDLFYSESPSTPGKSPVMSNEESSPTPGISGPSKHTDDQLQQQISEILESIPARIRLTSEPDTSGTSDIRQSKKRISLNPFSRPASRAATPSFTLAPVYAKNPRPRPQNGNPEIKLYHLSRSTGEAPIKLFVRLVGEKGERVMVRVGGGWADLGEYLKEYASHHGRRSDQPGKVEIQDIPSRVVSTSSTTSTTTLRNGTWNTSEASSPISRPGSRPASALGRPLSSLAIRKTRKSVGEEARENAYRSPSTPLSPSFRPSPSESRSNDTPNSVNSARSVSQMSWREEESSLGLAGPRSRKGEISAENAAWVESMKEKVRIASVEKDKKDKSSFGEMGQVGATKRLFKKSG